MTRNRMLFFALSMALVLPIVAATFFAAAADDDRGEDSLVKYLTVFTEVISRVRQGYVEPVEMEALISGALEGSTDALDPFSLYIPPRGVEPFLRTRAVGSRHSGLLMLKEQGVVYAVGVQPGSPAAAAGVEVGDLVSKIHGRPTRTMPLWEAHGLLAEAGGEQVELELLRQGEQQEVTLELEPFEPPRAEFRVERGVAVLRLPSFGPATESRVEEMLVRAGEEGHRSLLIDLRGVAGGDSETAYRVAGLFSRGELGSLRRRQDTITRFTGAEEPAWQGRVVVLVDRGTLGPAELLATTLRQKIDAELVGQRTFGYAGRQELVELETGGRLLITDAFYTGPDAEPLREGLVPDLRVDNRSRRLAETDTPLEDLILDRGLSLILDEEPARKAA